MTKQKRTRTQEHRRQAKLQRRAERQKVPAAPRRFGRPRDMDHSYDAAMTRTFKGICPMTAEERMDALYKNHPGRWAKNV